MENNKSGKNSGIVLSPAEAEEYCEFKRQKRVAEVQAALTKSELQATGRELAPGEIKRVADSAGRVKSAAVRTDLLHVPCLKNALGNSGTAVDCVVGGTGETTAKVKAYETKQALRAGAKEITLILSYSALKSGRTGDTKREIKKVCRAARRAAVKVAADKSLTYAELLRLARLVSDCKAKYLSVEFFPDCGRLKRDLHDGCMLEVTGVETAAAYKALVAVGAERIGTSHADEIYAELIKEAENCSFAVSFADSVTVAPSVPPAAPASAAAPAAAARPSASVAQTKPPEDSKEDGTKVKAEQMSVLGDRKLLGGTFLK